MPAMSINAADKCPHCGTPYMSMLKEGEDPAGRYCYTCETTAGGAQMAATLAAAADADLGDELQLQPLDGDNHGGPRRGRMAPGGRPNFKPAAKSGPRPATGSRNNMPAVGSRAKMPAVTGSRANMPAVTGSRNNMPAVTGSRNNMPAVAASRANMAAVPPPPVEYEEIPLEAEVEEAPPQIEQPQPEQRPSRAGIPAARRGSSVSLIPVTDKKGSTVNLIAVGDMKKGSSVNLVPAMKSQSGKHHAARSSQRMAAVPGGKTSASMAAVAMPGQRSSARQKAVAVDDDKKNNTLIYGAIGGGVLILLLMVFAFTGSKKQLPQIAEYEARNAKRTDEPRVAIAPVATPAPEVKAAEVKTEAPKAEAAAKTEAPAKTETAAKTEAPAEKATEAKKEAPEAAAAPTETAKPAGEDKSANVADLLANAGTRKAPNAKLDDDDDIGAAKTKRPAPAAEPKAAAKPGAATPPALGPDGEPKKNGGDPMVALGLKKKEPEAEDPKPGAKIGPVPITATEPTLVPIDFAKGDRNQETTFSETVNRVNPGWRVRDLKLEVSSASSEQRGRPECITFQPLNDVLPTKFIATVEIPQSYAQKRPTLLFETSVKEGTAKGSAKPMFVSVKVTNLDVNPRQQMEILPKQMVKGSKEQPWLDSVVDLSMLAGRRAEIQIEVSVPPKTKPEVLKDYIGYMRGMRLEWAGKPRTAAPAKPKP